MFLLLLPSFFNLFYLFNNNKIKSIKLKTKKQKKKYVGLSYFSCVLKRKNSDTSNWVIKMKRVS